MTFPAPNNAYSQNTGMTFGSGAPHQDVRAPVSSDVNFAISTRWIWPNNGIWELIGFSSVGGILTANWVQLAATGSNVFSVTGTANQVTATPTTGSVVVSIPNPFVAPGTITGTTITANGNLVLGAAGGKISIHASTPASDSVGTSAALDGLAPSQRLVSTTAVTASSIILLSYATVAGTPGSLSVGTIVPGVSFQIKSSASGDTSTVNYLIIN